MVLGDALNGFNQVGTNGVLNVVALLDQFEKLHSAMLDEDGIGFLHVFAIVHVDIELLGLQRNGERKKLLKS